MIVRPAIGIDAGSIARVQVASWQEAYRDILPTDYLADLSISERLEIWANSILKNMPQVLVAEVAGQVVGFSATGPCRDDGASSASFEIWAIYVALAHWSLGIGRELWLASREAFVKCGARSISLWVITDNVRAIRFYRAAGFVADVGSLKPFELGGLIIEQERYVCDL